MPIHIATTTITFVEVTSEPHMPEVSHLLASGIRGHIEAIIGSARGDIGNQRQETKLVAYTDMIEPNVTLTTHLIDERTGLRYEVDVAHKFETDNPIFSYLNHIEVSLTRIVGGAAR